MTSSSSSSSSSSSAYNFFLAVFLVVITLANAQLSPSFYDSGCPLFAQTARSIVRTAVAQEQRMGASLLRLHFHDCFVQGCDASILLDDTANFTGEKTAIPNVNSVRGYEVIDQIKAQVESVCPGVVSCADIVAVAARDGVVALGGPSWTVPFGRRDSITANITAANNELPSPFLNLTGLIDSFSNKGFTASEMVTLSGAHTIGLARCSLFRERIYNETNIDPDYAASLRLTCPRVSGNGDNNLAPMDVQSSENFDNDYYENLIGQYGLLHSDQELTSTTTTTLQVALYSVSNDAFFDDFSDAMNKMSLMSPLTGTQGQIRANCRRVNPTVGRGSGLEMASEGGRASY